MKADCSVKDARNLVEVTLCKGSFMNNAHTRYKDSAQACPVMIEHLPCLEKCCVTVQLCSGIDLGRLKKEKSPTDKMHFTQALFVMNSKQ